MLLLQLWEANKLIWANGLNPYNLYGMCDGGVTPDSVHEDHVFIPEETPAFGKAHFEDMMKVIYACFYLPTTNMSW